MFFWEAPNADWTKARLNLGPAVGSAFCHLLERRRVH